MRARIQFNPSNRRIAFSAVRTGGNAIKFAERQSEGGEITPMRDRRVIARAWGGKRGKGRNRVI